MQQFWDVTVNCDKETAKIYEWARGEFAADDKPTNPITFPLEGCTVTHNGSRAVISLPRPGGRALILDRLINADEPTESGRDGKTRVVSGQSERLYMQGINPEDGVVSFTLKMSENSAAHLSGVRQ